MTLDIFAELKRLDWIDEGICRDYKSPDDWYLGGEYAPMLTGGYNAETSRAIAICRTCPVMAECARYAIEHNEVHGVWGSLTPYDRRVIRLRKQRQGGVA
jgi:WhiB family redox-sensing transcriptional regulator